MNILVFEDEQVTRLYPITLARPAYAISCGAYRLIDWLRELGRPIFGVVREYLHEIQRVDYEDLNARPLSGSTLMVNARLIPSVHAYREIEKWAKDARPGWVMQGQEVAAVCLPSSVSAPPLDAGPRGDSKVLRHIETGRTINARISTAAI